MLKKIMGNEQELFILLVPCCLTLFLCVSTEGAVMLSVVAFPFAVLSFFLFKKAGLGDSQDLSWLTPLERKRLEKFCPSATIFKISEQELDLSDQQTLPLEIPTPAFKKKY